MGSPRQRTTGNQCLLREGEFSRRDVAPELAIKYKVVGSGIIHTQITKVNSAGCICNIYAHTQTYINVYASIIKENEVINLTGSRVSIVDGEK